MIKLTDEFLESSQRIGLCFYVDVAHVPSATRNPCRSNNITASSVDTLIHTLLTLF